MGHSGIVPTDADKVVRWRLVLLVAVAVLVAVGITAWILKASFFNHWLAVHTGTVNEAGPYYGFDRGSVPYRGARDSGSRWYRGLPPVQEVQLSRTWLLAHWHPSGGRRQVRGLLSPSSRLRRQEAFAW